LTGNSAWKSGQRPVRAAENPGSNGTGEASTSIDQVSKSEEPEAAPDEK